MKYEVRNIRFDNGEHLPALVNGSTGVPVFAAMNYVLGSLRSAGQATNTMEQCCRVLALVHHWLDCAGVDLLARCMSGRVLDDAEAEDLESLFRLGAKDFTTQCMTRYTKTPAATSGITTSSKVLSIAQFREMRVKNKVLASVSPQTLSIRMHHAQAYIKRIAYDYSSRASVDAKKREAIRAAADDMSAKFKALMPSSFASINEVAPEGLSSSEVEALIKIIDPAAANLQNPWSDPFARKRNHLMILTMLATGMRGGELLKMKTTDIQRHAAVVSITRSPNDAEDPRTRRPQAKTRARDLMLDAELYAGLNDFIQKERRAIPSKQRKHPFIWVTETGSPLSINAFGKVFATLRAKSPSLPKTLTSHVLRYTATDDLLSRLEASDASEDQVAEQLRYVMGWSPSSNMPAKYARRHIRDQANSALLDMQRSLFVKNKQPKRGADEEK